MIKPLARNVILSCILVTPLFLTGCNDAKAPAAQAVAPIATVEMLTLTPQPIVPYHTFIGRTEAENDVAIQPRVNGELMAIHFKDGQMVEKGQLLFEIDPRPYQAALESAQALLQEAEAQVLLTKRSAERANRLIKDKSISEQEHDTAVASYKTALAQKAKAKAAVLSAKLDLEYAHIRAPFSGRVGFSNVAVGDRITTLRIKSLVSLTQVNPMRFKFDVDEKLFRRIRSAVDGAHQKDKKLNVSLELTLSDGSVYPQEGHMYAIGNRINLDSGSINAEASFDNSNYSLMPGEYGEVTIKLKGQTVDGLLIPVSAVQQDQSGDFVMVVDSENKASRRNVTLGQTYGVKRAVLTGLEAGERIVLSGLQKVRPGMQVQEPQSQPTK